MAGVREEEAAREAEAAAALAEGLGAEGKKVKKKRKPRSKKKKSGEATAPPSGVGVGALSGSAGAATDPVTLSEAKRRSHEVDQLYTAARACLQKHALDESLEHHNNVVRAANQMVEEFDPDSALKDGTDEMAALLTGVRGTRARAMAETVTLLAHAERFETVPHLCTQLLEASCSESEQTCWLFHRGRAHVKRWELQQQRRPREEATWMGSSNSAQLQEANESNSLVRLALEDFNQALRSDPDNHEVLQWRAWVHWLMGQYEICAADCDRGLVTHPRNIPLLRLRGDALVELRLFRRALNDFDSIVHLFTESGDEGRQADLQELIRRKHSVAAQFLLQADELTERLLTQVDGKDGSDSNSSTAQENQMGLFHGMLLREGQFTGVIHIGNGVTSCILDDAHKEMLDSALTCMSKHQFKEALAKVKELRELGNEMLRGPLMCFDAELKMNAVQLAMTTETQGRLDDITPILDYAICIFRESAEAHYHRQALWILATVFIKRGKLRTAVRVLDDLIRTHPQYRHSYCQKVELLKADGCSIKEVANVVQHLEKLKVNLQGASMSGDDASNGSAPEPEQGMETMQEDSDDDANSGKSQAEAHLLLQNAKRSLATMRKDATSGVTQRVREAIQSRIQLIYPEAASRPVLVSLAAAVAYTHAQRFRLAQEMIGKTIKQNSSIAEIFVVRAHVRYTEGSSCDGESAVRCWEACNEDCDHALRLNNECWPALWWKAQALSHLSDTDGKEACARDALSAMQGLLEFQPSFKEAPEFKSDFANLNQKVMLADALQSIELYEYEKSLVITSRLLDVSPRHTGALRSRATALGEMLKRKATRIEPIFRDAMLAEEQILSLTDEQSADHIDALARRTETSLEYMTRIGMQIGADNDQVSSLFTDLNKALQLDSKHRRSLLLRAKLNELLRKPEMATADCTQVLDGLAVQVKVDGVRKLDNTCNRERLEALEIRARAFMQVRRYREAMVDYDMALQICSCSGRDATMASLKEQKEAASRALQAEVNAAEAEILEELAKDDAAEASAQAKRTRKKAKKLRQQESDKKPAAISNAAAEAGSSAEIAVETIELVEVPDRPIAGSSQAGSQKERNKGRRKNSKNGRQNNKAGPSHPAAPRPAVAEVGPPQELIHAAQEQLAALFSDLSADETKAALVKTGYNVEAACNNILAGAEGPSADLLVPGTLLEVADEWEQVSTARSSTKPKQGLDRCISTFSKAGLKLRRTELDEACWARLAEVSDSTLVETARQYLHRQRMAKRGQGQPVQNKSAFMISVVHKLSQKATVPATSNGQTSPRKSGKRATSESPGESTSLTSRSPHSDDAEADVRTTADLDTPELLDTDRNAPTVAAHPPHGDTAMQSQQPASSTSPSAEHDKADHAMDHRQQQGDHVEPEEDVAFGAAPVADDPGADEDGILFGAAQPEDDDALMFGAPAEAAVEKQQSSIPAAKAELTQGSGTSDAELDPLELHCRRLRQPGYPAGELEVRALADMLSCESIPGPLPIVATRLL
jgi:tetratricopeptide (TPR) repeat protein